MMNNLKLSNWIKLYIFWELSLVKELGFEINLPDKKYSTNSANYTVALNDKVFKITSPLSDDDKELRYGIFRYNPGKEEYILGGVKSWAEK